MTPADYDAWYATPRGRWIGETEYALAVRSLAAQPGERLLDVGCGTGWFTRRAAADGQPRRDHARVVHHHHVGGAEKLRQVQHPSVGEAEPGDMQKPRGIPRPRRFLGDQPGRQVEIIVGGGEGGGVHGLRAGSGWRQRAQARKRGDGRSASVRRPAPTPPPRGSPRSSP